MKYYMSHKQLQKLDGTVPVHVSRLSRVKTDLHNIECEIQWCSSCEYDFIVEPHNDYDYGYFCNACASTDWIN
jgi:hypothetical protein